MIKKLKRQVRLGKYKRNKKLRISNKKIINRNNQRINKRNKKSNNNNNSNKPIKIYKLI